MEGDFSCLTYENMLSKEEIWNDCEHVWLMGNKYSLPEQKNLFLNAVRTKFWFTYRKGFSPIGGIGPTSDSGWGCMLRCGQMMLAQTLMKLRMKENWKWRSNELLNKDYYKILEQFVDKRSSCYSIHQIAQMGVQEGKPVGDWFGPNTIAQVLKKLCTFDDRNDLSIYVAMDNTICIDEVVELCGSEVVTLPSNHETTSKSSSQIENSSIECWKPLLIIVPLRLGLAEINSVYFESIKQCFSWKESVGMIGGKPNHAYYFMGCTDTQMMVFLDPHTTQPSVAEETPVTDIAFDSTYHCEEPSRMPISQLDPSLAVGFLCKTKLEFDEFCKKVRAQTNIKGNLPLFTVIDTMPKCNVVESRVVSVSVHNRDKLRTGKEGIDENACLTLDSDEDLDDVDEEFEILDIS